MFNVFSLSQDAASDLRYLDRKKKNIFLIKHIWQFFPVHPPFGLLWYGLNVCIGILIKSKDYLV